MKRHLRWLIPAAIAGSVGVVLFSCLGCCLFFYQSANTPEAREQARLRMIAEKEAREIAEQKAKENRKQREIEAKENAEKDKNRQRPNRANYNRITQGMHVNDVEDILGPGKESSQSGPILTLTWHEFLGPRIVIIFENNRVQTKSIFD